MFCQACGNPVKEDLRYCNRCGARVNYALAREEG
jgi:predicted amidophosphoribosyltransferase